jgi:hypothetical protein
MDDACPNSLKITLILCALSAKLRMGDDYGRKFAFFSSIAIFGQTTPLLRNDGPGKIFDPVSGKKIQSAMNPLPPPRATFAGCIWLARILEKARRIQNGTLPAEYAARFGASNGTDGQFLGFFGLEKEQILAVAGVPEEEIERWFLDLPGVDLSRIAAWNQLAVNLGREGYPMQERLPVALATTYAHLDPRKIHSVFEALEADEGI